MNFSYSFPDFGIREFYENYPQVTVSWVLISIISILISFYSSAISNETTRSVVVRPLLIGVITLFTISLTVTIMGIQVASNRYTHRVDSIVIRKRVFWLHFLPHLLATLFAILMLSVGRFVFFDFFMFVLFISASLLGVFPFLQWLLTTLSPEMMLSTSLQHINSDFLDRTEEVVREERSEIMDDGDRESFQDIFREMAYLGISKEDPVDRSMDIIRTRIQNNDTGTAKSLIDQYSNYVISVLERRYQEFRSSHSDSQLVSWYLLGSFEDLFQLAIKEGNHRISQEIISLQRKSIQNWYRNNDSEIPEVFFRVFNSISVEYLSFCNGGQATGVAREYGKIARIIASDIESSERKVGGANTANFVSSCMAYAERSIDQNYIKSATLIRSALRFIVDARLRTPSSNPDREILMIGLIGEMFAMEEVVSKDIVEIANETLDRDQAEGTIVTLVTFKDKLEDDEEIEEDESILEKVMDEIERVNLALEKRDKEAASKVPYDENLVLNVIRGSRLFRSSFSVDELIEEIGLPDYVENKRVEEICEELEDLDVLEDGGEDEYIKSRE